MHSGELGFFYSQMEVLFSLNLRKSRNENMDRLQKYI